MSSLDPSEVSLADVFTDHTENLKDTDVYSNGEMQAVVYPSVNYSGSSSVDIDALKQYIQDNVVIYDLDTQQPLDTTVWIKSKVSNGLQHDINRGTVTPGSKIQALSDFRSPIYFTVPRFHIGEFRWYAELGSRQTNKKSPVRVIASYFPQLSETDFEIIDHFQHTVDMVVRVIRYKFDANVPSYHLLVKCLDYKGVKFPYSAASSPSTCWLGMIQDMRDRHTKWGAFLERRKTKAIVGGHSKGNFIYRVSQCKLVGVKALYYPQDELGTSDRANWFECESIPASELDEGWNKGIVMILYSNNDMFVRNYNHDRSITLTLNVHVQDIRIQDNFGNIIRIDFNWDTTGQYSRDWKVINPRVINSS